MKVGFIGLGTMGAGMARNLAEKGYELLIYDVNAAAIQQFANTSATVADSISQLGRDADVVFTSLPTPKDMQTVAHELIECMRSGSAWFDLTSNSPTVVRGVAQDFAARGIAVCDAPVSGGKSGARSGNLALYVGADRDVFAKHKALLEAIGDRIILVGEVGAGCVAKIVHNQIALVVRSCIAEGMSLGAKAGLDPKELWYAVRQGGFGRARGLDTVCEQYLESRYEPATFSMRLAHKDLALAMDLAREFDVPMKVSTVVLEDYVEALDRGWAERDSRAVMDLQNQRAGVTIKVAAEDVKSMLARG